MYKSEYLLHGIWHISDPEEQMPLIVFVPCWSTDSLWSPCHIHCHILNWHIGNMHCKRKEGKNITIYSGLWEASWLMLPSPDLVVRFGFWPALCYFLGQARHFTLTVSLSTQSYKWVHGGVEILLVALCYGNQNKLQPDEPLGLKLCRLPPF